VTLPAGLLARPIAHRGLWSVGARPENSLAAFAAAAEAGYGIELDVQISADGEAVVFHDDTLERMTRQAGIVEERTVEELATCRLLGSRETIPTLAAALSVIDGRVPVLVELKTPPGQEGALEERVAALLQGYAGPLAVIGFNSDSLACMARLRPDLPRGLDLETADRAAQLDGRLRSARSDEAHIAAAEPDFLVPRLDLVCSAAFVALRAGGLPLVPWTVRRPAEWEEARDFADAYIFEDFLP
jgi:glycerophosphoryl diester phosphodiesterase